MNEWIEGNNKGLMDQFPNMKIDSLDAKYDNISEKSGITGKYKSLLYEYSDNRKEVMLIIECEFSIITLVFSSDSQKDYKKNIDSFISLCNSFMFISSKVEIE